MQAEMMRSSGAQGGEVLESEFVRVVFQKGFPAQVGINGCRLQDVLKIAVERLSSYQAGPLACVENEAALKNLSLAIDALDQRIQRRQEQGVFETNNPHLTRRTEDHNEDFSATGA